MSAPFVPVSGDTSEVEAAFADGRLRIDVDPERRIGHLSFVDRTQHWDALGALVHVISRPAGGEIRGYVRIDGRLHLRLPCSPLDWPELDEAVQRKVGLPVVSLSPAAINARHRVVS